MALAAVAKEASAVVLAAFAKEVSAVVLAAFAQEVAAVAPALLPALPHAGAVAVQRPSPAPRAPPP